MNFKPRDEFTCQISFLQRECGSAVLRADMARNSIMAQTIGIKDLTDSSYLLFASLMDMAEGDV